MATLASTCDDIPSAPYQPQHFKFPVREFGSASKRKGSCKSFWFQKWKWLHYDPHRDVMLCFFCMKAVKTEKIKFYSPSHSFISTGFCRWVDGPKTFDMHEHTIFHKKCKELIDGHQTEASIV